jgi:hypothetical protein
MDLSSLSKSPLAVSSTVAASTKASARRLTFSGASQMGQWPVDRNFRKKCR